MKYIKLYEEYLNGDKLKGKVYHVSNKPIKRLSTDSMWFALEKSHSDDGWLPNTITYGWDEAYQYEGSVAGKIGNVRDPNIKKILKEVGIDAAHYRADLTTNPTSKQVMGFEGTQALMKAGYDGLIYLDLDPRDYQKDLEALIVFNPIKTIKGWKLLKK